MRTILTAAVLACLLSSCGSFLPTNGPSSSDIRQGSLDENSLPYALVPLTSKVVEELALYGPRLSNLFPDRRPPADIRFGVGDSVSVTIFEAAAGGLFIPLEAGVRPGNFVTLPTQHVDNKGNISVPYAGAVRAKDRTPTEVQEAIVNELKKRAIEPQAVVSLVSQETSLISVLGDVNKPDRYPAPAAGERILDAIARAGGPKVEGFDTWIMLERGGRRATVPFGALVYEPSNNIYVHPADTIYAYSEPQAFLAFGAVQGSGSVVSSGLGGLDPNRTGTTQGQYSFGGWRLSLTEAVAKAGGLNDVTADPASVFLYRGETRQVAERLGIDCSRFSGPVIPVIYNVNFRDPSGFFLASKFEMRNKDILYVSNAEAVEVSKFLVFVRLVMGTANDPVTYTTNGFILRNVANTKTTATTIAVTPAVAGR
jgi:polysaccharide export outer membrane protein